MIKTGFALSCIIFSTSVLADQTWQCQNIALLELCNNLSCSQNPNPNPLGKNLKIHLKNDQQLSICTQSSCWSGQLHVSQKSNVTVLKLNDVVWKAPENGREHYILSIHPQSQNIYFEGPSGRHPINCKNI